MKEILLKEILLNATNKLEEVDTYLFEHDLHEQTVTSRISHYLEKINDSTAKKWNIDVEYNRNQNAPKALQNIGNVRPDILIHRRGENNLDETDDNNLLIIEAKKNPSTTEKTEDIRKIKAFIEESPFRYLYGAFIEIKTSSKSCNILWFSRDDLTGENL